MLLLRMCLQVSAGGSGGSGQQSEEAELQAVCGPRTAHRCPPPTL